uniref:dihydroxy-acid dehydratase domain-containing protein n=1 Tax=Hyphomonas sp. TaxID=87 RepID=UPI0030FD0216
LMDGGAQGVAGPISGYDREPFLDDGKAVWRAAPEKSGDMEILRSASDPFSEDGGLRLMSGPLGRGVSKVSAVKPANRVLEAPAIVFETQGALKAAFEAGKLDRDFVAVVRFQGPAANGMPELHGLTPVLGILQDRGFKIALVTDGRMSGASGKIPSAIHMSPEAARGGPLARVRDGDLIVFDSEKGTLDIKVDSETFASREPAPFRPNESSVGLGREMFSYFRQMAGTADSGASQFSFFGEGS